MRGLIFSACLWLQMVFGALLVFGGGPENWQTGFQKSVTPVMEHVISLYHFMSYILAGVVAVVLGLLLYVILRFNSKANVVPNKFAHNVVIEVVWTIIPVILLIIIAIPSFKILRYSQEVPESELTIKVVGYQWYWKYEYPEYGISFDSYMITDDKLQPNQKRLFDVDNRVIAPENTNVKLIVTAGDVIHSFAVPSFGIKIDGVPGRINETWFNVKEKGVYYGQCSELCGANHGFMPIAVEIVSQEEFKNWVKSHSSN